MRDFETNLKQLAINFLMVAALASPSAWSEQPTPTSQFAAASQLTWSELPPIPDELGLAGPVVGVHRELLLVGGGANFPHPVWETHKLWLRALYGLRRTESGNYEWHQFGELPSELAYSACASTSQGIVIAGGNDATQIFDRCWLAQVDTLRQRVAFRELPKLPQPCVYGQACAIGDVVYLAGGQSTSSLTSAMSNLWKLDLSKLSSDEQAVQWSELPACPGPPRAFNITAAVGSGEAAKLFVVGGRRAVLNEVTGIETPEFLRDCWEFDPRMNRWRKRADMPRASTAGTAIGWDDSNLLVISGDDGALFARTDELKDKHPGFPRKFYLYNSDSNAWSEGDSPANQVTTTAVWFDHQVVVPTGELRPRVRTPKVWSIR